MELHDRVAVITGAGSGIGLALAERLAADGMRLGLFDVDGAAVDAVADRLGDDHLAISVDVRDGVSFAAAADEVIARLGAPALLCLNAGVSGATGAPLWQTAPQDWEWVVGVNLMGVVHGVRTLVPPAVAAGGRFHVVITASLSGLLAFPGAGPYVATKHATLGLATQLALEFDQHGVDAGVTALCPAWVRTRILDDERTRPADLAVAGRDRPDTSELAAGMAATGLDPATVADEVVEAVHAGRFLVTPNHEWDDAVARHVPSLLAGATPRMPGPKLG